MPLNVNDRRCGNCKHATQEGLSKHYRRWLIECKVAVVQLRRADEAFSKVKNLPKSIHGPDVCLLDFDDDSPCPLWTPRSGPAIGGER